MFDYLAPLYDHFLNTSRRFTIDPILNNVDFSDFDNVLDIGGGTGFLGKEIKKKWELEYFVVDENQKMINKAKMKDLDCVIRADVVNLPFKNQVFDCLLCVDALHHFYNKFRSLKEMLRVLRHEGELIIVDLIPRRYFTKLISYLERLVGEPTVFLGKNDLADFFGEDYFFEELNYFLFIFRVRK